MYSDKVNEIKEEIKECLNDYGFNCKVNVENGNNGIIVVREYNSKTDKIKELIEEKFKDKVQVKNIRNWYYTTTKNIVLQTTIEKEGIDLEIEKLEIKLKELKAERTRQKEKKAKQKKIEKLKEQLRKME